MFHANGWGMPFGITGIGGEHIILRQVDGHEILRRVRDHAVTLMCAAPAVVNMILDAASTWSEGEIPVAIACASSLPALLRRRARSNESFASWAGSSSRSTA